MGPLVSTPSPLINTTQNRVDSSNPQFRENRAATERLDLTKTTGTSSARAQNTETRNYKATQDLQLANAQIEEQRTTSTNGQRRGGVLDISV